MRHVIAFAVPPHNVATTMSTDAHNIPLLRRRFVMPANQICPTSNAMSATTSPVSGTHNGSVSAFCCLSTFCPVKTFNWEAAGNRSSRISVDASDM